MRTRPSTSSTHCETDAGDLLLRRRRRPCPPDENVSALGPCRYSRGVMSPGRHVRTRLYFTSESHVHSLLNVFRYGGLLDV